MNQSYTGKKVPYLAERGLYVPGKRPDSRVELHYLVEKVTDVKIKCRRNPEKA